MYQSFAGRGIDVASQRADDLDKLSLEYFSKKAQARVLDLGCGTGGHSLRMAKVGAKVLGIDIDDFENDFHQYRIDENINKKYLSFIQGDIRNLSVLLTGKNFTDIYMQRTLHYLPHTSALDLLKFLYKISEDRLYISVSGLASDIGKGYESKLLPIEERFGLLDSETGSVFQINEPVCLYTQSEFVALLELSGWRIVRCWQSAFGNHKAVCSH